jgi:A/G-specific adenine glycosylase
MSAPISERLLSWFAHNARQLPWRGQNDPYAIWVSEIMLQQTRVETVIPYYKRWMELFPTLGSLADASQQEALAAWEGLGYYSRARNLHRAAQMVMLEYGGEVPSNPDDLRRLPGIGRYTAGAIASIAFNLDEPALDGNIRRVLARVFNVSEPARSPEGERKLWELAAANLPTGQAGAYNEALMELGATVCTPRAPECSRCPLVDLCQANALGLQTARPVSLSRPAIPHYTVTAAVIRREGRVLIAQRPVEGLLGGMWEFPGGKLIAGEDLATCLRREICEELAVGITVGGSLGVYRHAYTHFKVTLHAFSCVLNNGVEPSPLQAQELRWVELSVLPDYPMGKIDRKIADRLLSETHADR